MASIEDPKGAGAPHGEVTPENGASAPPEPGAPIARFSDEVEEAYNYIDEYPAEDRPAPPTTAVTVAPPPPPPPVKSSGGRAAPPPPPTVEEEDEDGDDDGMLRMSFLEHLEELRSRLLKMLMGAAVAFFLSLTFSNQLWKFVQQPARDALTTLGIKPPNLIAIEPMEQFNIIWVKLPILTAIFIASPWIIFQIWGFIAPGLYKRERRWAVPFVICTAGLFISGGAFAYFVAFRYGLTFLLGIGMDVGVTPMITMSRYFDLFVNVMLGVSLVFELPVLIFFLTLLRIVTPSFLLRNSRYAILIIVIVAAVLTPTPDIINLTMFSVPMILLFYVGIFASYLLTLSREGRNFPWTKVFYFVVVVALAIAGLVYLAISRYGYHLENSWPFLTR